MTKHPQAAAAKPLLLILGLAVLLAGCGAAGSAPGSQSSVAVRTRLPVLFHDVPETLFIRPADPLPAGPVANLRGLYGAAGPGDTSLALCRLEGGQLLCRQYSAPLETAGPLLVEASGQVDGATVAVGNWQPLDWDAQGQRAAAQAELEKQAPTLASYQWEAIALPNYADSTGWFKGDEERFRALPLELYGYDTTSKRFIWRAQGWELPQQQHLVHRYPVIYIVTDPAGKKPTETFVTIEGYAEE